jgi:glycerophosphoryl diester phosphodiesterase
MHWLLATPIAHRGLHDVADGRPENSRAAFVHAAEQGFPIELDVQLAHGRLLVAHDPVGPDSDAPELADVLDDVCGRVPLLIDLKSANRGALARAIVPALEGYAGHVALQDFNPLSLAVLRHAPYPRGQISGRLDPAPAPIRPIGRAMPTNALLRPDFMNVELAALPSRATAFWRRRGVPLLAWTAGTPEEARRAAAVADNYLFSGFVP